MTNTSSPSQGKNRGPNPGWPGWARVLVSLALLYHGAAVIAGAWAFHPLLSSSEKSRTCSLLIMTWSIRVTPTAIMPSRPLLP